MVINLHVSGEKNAPVLTQLEILQFVGMAVSHGRRVLALNIDSSELKVSSKKLTMAEEEIEAYPNVSYLRCSGNAPRVKSIEESRKPVPVVPMTPVHVKSLPIKSIILVILMLTQVIVIAIISAALAIFAIRFAKKEEIIRMLSMPVYQEKMI